MTLTRTSFETGANGDPMSSANTNSSFEVHSGGNAFISTATPVVGTRSLRMVGTTASGGVYFARNGLASTAYARDFTLRIIANMSANAAIWWIGAGSTREMSIELTPARTLLLKNAAGTVIWTSAAIPFDTSVRVSVYVVQSGTVGVALLGWWLDPLSTGSADSTSGTLNNQNTGASTYTDERVGVKCTTGSQTGTIDIDIPGWDPAATGLNTPYTSNTAPSSDAGADIAVDAGQPFTLTGIPTDAEGITSVAWKLAGNTVGTTNVLNRTAPITIPGASEVYTFEVVDSGGLTASDTATVTVRPAATHLHDGTSVKAAITRLAA